MLSSDVLGEIFAFLPFEDLDVTLCAVVPRDQRHPFNELYKLRLKTFAKSKATRAVRKLILTDNLARYEPRHDPPTWRRRVESRLHFIEETLCMAHALDRHIEAVLLEGSTVPAFRGALVVYCYLTHSVSTVQCRFDRHILIEDLCRDLASTVRNPRSRQCLKVVFHHLNRLGHRDGPTSHQILCETTS